MRETEPQHISPRETGYVVICDGPVSAWSCSTCVAFGHRRPCKRCPTCHFGPISIRSHLASSAGARPTTLPVWESPLISSFSGTRKGNRAFLPLHHAPSRRSIPALRFFSSVQHSGSRQRGHVPLSPPECENTVCVPPTFVTSQQSPSRRFCTRGWVRSP